MIDPFPILDRSEGPMEPHGLPILKPWQLPVVEASILDLKDQQLKMTLYLMIYGLLQDSF